MASISLLEADLDVRRLLLILLTDLGHDATVLDAGADVPRDSELLLVDPASPLHHEQVRRARAQNPVLPIICMRYLAEHERFRAAGRFVHLGKPFTADELEAAIELALA
jgi:DNA-binding response OmpR family regulator